jgi:hypothetical protein
LEGNKPSISLIKKEKENQKTNNLEVAIMSFKPKLRRKLSNNSVLKSSIEMPHW